MFKVSLSNKAEKFAKKCGTKLKNRLKRLFERLEQNPVPARDFDLRKIAGAQDTYRIRLSSVRATYSIYWEEKKIRALKIERRKESTYKRP